MSSFTLRVLRGTPNNQYWEEFRLPIVPMSNVISSLMEIQKEPVNVRGERVSPVVWEQGCLEEVCGSCSMLVNGVPRQACTALIEPIVEGSGSELVTVAPLTKFPLVRDLMVDRSAMFENLKQVHAWVESDGAYERGPGPKIGQKKQEMRYILSTCMTCGCCSEACPQVNLRSDFMGPAPIAQVESALLYPMGEKQREERIRSVMGKGGVAECGNAQNCVRVCPKKIPLTTLGIGAMGRATTLQMFKEFFGISDTE